MANKLSNDDVKKLAADRSVENRAVMAEKVAAEFSADGLTDAELSLAQDIFRVMLQDVELRVREALSDGLHQASHLAPDLAQGLANDESDSVALPVIRHSKALNDTDLIDIVRRQGDTRQIAVAERPVVSESVSDAVVEYGGEEAVVSLVSNQGARIAEDTYDKVIDKHGDNERVQEPLARRDELPVAVAERLVALVSEDLKNYILMHHELSEEVAADLVLHSRERTTIGLVSAGATAEEVEDLVRQMHANDRLTPSIILRALCTGDLNFFETSLAVLAGIPVINASLLVHDEGNLGLRSLYDKAGLPRVLFNAFRRAMDLNIELEIERTDDDPEQTMRRILERVLTQTENADEDLGVENVDYLLSKYNKTDQEVRTG